MRIEKISLYHVVRPFLTPFSTAFGDTTHIESVLLRMESEGVVGWGEACPLSPPLYSPEWAGSVYATIEKWLAPRFIGREISSGQEIQQLFSPFKGNFFAKAALDLAWWDLKAKQENLPLWKLLGGEQSVVDVGADFGVVDSPQILLDDIAQALEEGYPRIKLKVRRGWDAEIIELVRSKFPDATFHIDANSGYTLADIDIFRRMDDLGLAMMEQPLAHDDLLDHAKLAKQLKTPICLDETITSVARATQAIEIGACGFINIKPGRVGGITNAVEILRVARENNIPCWIGGMFESAIGASHCLALATLPGMGYAADIFPSKRFVERDITPHDIELYAPGKVAAFEGAGIGCIPDLERLKEVTVQSCEFVAQR